MVRFSSFSLRVGLSTVPPARADVVDEMEGSGRRVQDLREAAASLVWQAVEEADYRQQAAHDEVSEHHVEQQLLVGPARTVRRSLEV